MILASGKERLTEALHRLASDAAELLDELLESGASLPFEITSSDQGPLPMYQYSPSTGDFIREQAAELRRLDSFIEVRSMIGEDRAIDFLGSLWEGRSEFTTDEDALERLVREVAGNRSTAGGTAGGPTGDVCVPIVGLRMEVDELELGGVRLVRADDADDLPDDAVAAANAAAGNFASGFVAIAPCRGDGETAVATARDELRRLLTTLRLFKRGGVGLHPYGWIRRTGRWERFGTGAGRPRHGGYEVSRSESEDLAGLAEKLCERETRNDALAWAMSRFELGAERSTLIEALSDYLLAMRGLLEGGGPARAALPVRVSALCAEPPERDEVRSTVERAVAVERKLMSGARFGPSAAEEPSPRSSPLVVVEEVEELLRHILERMAVGELGTDLRVTADEIMLADGVGGAGGGSTIERGETAEWQLPDLSEIDDIYIDSIEADEIEHGHLSATDRIEVRELSDTEKIELEVAPESDIAPNAEDAAMEPAQLDPSERKTRIIACGVEVARHMAERTKAELLGNADWLEDDSSGSVDWPAFASPRRDRRRSEKGARVHANERVRYLFPVPDGTDWSVGELDYDRDSARANSAKR